MGLDIPNLLAKYNDFRYVPSFNVSMLIDALPEDKTPAACIACGKCVKVCPQGIDIPGVLKDFVDRMSKVPSWLEICRQREEAQKKNRV